MLREGEWNGEWRGKGGGRSLEENGDGVGLRCVVLFREHGIVVREWEGMENRRGVPIVDMGPNGQ